MEKIDKRSKKYRDSQKKGKFTGYRIKDIEGNVLSNEEVVQILCSPERKDSHSQQLKGLWDAVKMLQEQITILQTTIG